MPRVNNRVYIEEGHIMQWPKEKRTKEQIYKTFPRKIQIEQDVIRKTWMEMRVNQVHWKSG
jgi:hypothetical protein